MHDLNGQIAPDTSTANPPAYNTWKAADKDTLMNAVLMFDEANKKLNKENLALRADIAKLEAENAEFIHLRNGRIAILESENTRLLEENAELRKKCMTNMERIQTADIDALATYLWEISLSLYGVDFGDGVENELDYAFNAARVNNNPLDIKRWLERTEWR